MEDPEEPSFNPQVLSFSSEKLEEKYKFMTGRHRQ